MQTCLLYIDIIHDVKGRQNIIVICKELVTLVQKILNKFDEKRDSDTECFL